MLYKTAADNVGPAKESAHLPSSCSIATEEDTLFPTPPVAEKLPERWQCSVVQSFTKEKDQQPPLSKEELKECANLIEKAGKVGNRAKSLIAQVDVINKKRIARKKKNA